MRCRLWHVPPPPPNLKPKPPPPPGAGAHPVLSLRRGRSRSSGVPQGSTASMPSTLPRREPYRSSRSPPACAAAQHSRLAGGELLIIIQLEPHLQTF